MRRKARALRAERLLRDLDQDLLSLFDKLVDRLVRLYAPRGFQLFLFLIEGFEFHAEPYDIREIQVTVLLEAEADERGLDRRHDRVYPAFKDIAYETLFAYPLDRELLEDLVLEYRESLLLRLDIDQDFFSH